MVSFQIKNKILMKKFVKHFFVLIISIFTIQGTALAKQGMPSDIVNTSRQFYALRLATYEEGLFDKVASFF
jgi:hypothetical protein